MTAAAVPEAALSLTRAIAVVERGRRAGWWIRRGTPRSGFRYFDAQAARITDPQQIQRVRALRIPPAWHHVRIAPSPGSRLQAIGIDAAGRVQYLYHASFAARRQLLKYRRVEQFGDRLPELRRVSNADICRPDLCRERVLAVMVRLIDELHFRVGSKSGTARYRTYGITTLLNKHVRVAPTGVLTFSFAGKHHVRQRRILVDPELAAIVAEIKSLHGPRLFNYVDESGEVRPVAPRELNYYIKRAMGPQFSAKDFRTWSGTLLAATALAEMGPADFDSRLKRNLARVCRVVGERLGNTPTVCRASYIHPAVFERYRDGVTLDTYRRRADRIVRRNQPEYEPEELALLKLLREPPVRAANV